MGESVGHLKPDVASADNHGTSRLCCFEIIAYGEAVVHCVKRKHARSPPSFDWRLHRSRAGADDQLVVGKAQVARCNRSDVNGLRIRIDSNRGVSTTDVNALEFGPMRKAMPVWSLPTQKEREPADAVVGEIIRQQDGDFHLPIEFPCAKSSADACIAATDDQQSHADLLLSDTVDFSLEGERIQRSQR